MREVAALQEGIPRRFREIRPAARFPEDLEEIIKHVSPRVLQFSGHGDAIRHGVFAGALAFEVGDGTIQLPAPHLFIRLLDQVRFHVIRFFNAPLPPFHASLSTARAPLPTVRHHSRTTLRYRTRIIFFRRACRDWSAYS